MNRLRLVIVPTTKVILIELVIFFLVSCTGIKTNIETLINAETDVFQYTIEIDNGIDRISPVILLNSSFEYINETEDGEEVKFTDYFGLSDFDLVEHRAELPTIDESKRMTLIISDTITQLYIRVYDATGDALVLWDSWDEYGSLAEGEYFIEISISNELGEAYVNASCLFVLCVSRNN